MGSFGTTAPKLGGTFAALVCLVALCAGSASAAAKPLPKPVPVADDALARALAAGRLSPAKYALERARSLFELREVRRQFGDVARPDPHAATLMLRDLALRLRELSGTERREARRLLARPSDGAADPEENGWTVEEAPASPICDPNLCVHWVDDPVGDGPPPADEDANNVPDWVESVVATTFANVWTTEIGAMGNPPPLSDLTSPNNGGDARLDIYLADIGAVALFGYCTSDDPRLESGYLFYDVSAYCVVDNDFADFGADWLPEEFLQITAAHEFRHASQFAQDSAEDAWFMEGDAMWIEGEVYPDVTDRFDYLVTSQLTHPSVSVDQGAGYYEYGAWIFFRFLGEYFADVSVMRDAWTLADGSGDSDGPLGPDEEGPDEYSMQAVGHATGARGVSLASAYTMFTRWNRTPVRYYEEGAEYPAAPVVASYTLRPSAPTTGWKSRRIRHLAGAYYSFKPARSASRTARLKVTVDLPALVTKPAATLLVFFKSGAYSPKPISLDSSGNGAKTVSFGRGSVSRVDLVLANASARFDPYSCWTYTTDYSCGGAKALDENREYRFTAKLR